MKKKRINMQFFMKKKKNIAYGTLAIINNETEKARVCLEKLKKDCNKDKTKIGELEKKLLYVIKQEQIECSCKS